MSDHLHIAALLQLVRRRGLTIALAGVFAGILGYLYVERQAPIYETRALLEMSLMRPRIAGGTAVIQEGRVSHEVEFNTRLVKFQGSEMRKLALGKYRAAVSDRRSDAELLLELGSASRWEIRRQTQILESIARGTDPEFLSGAANAFADAAVDFMYLDNKRASDGAVKWLYTQASNQLQNVQRAESAVLEYRVDARLDQIEGQKQVLDTSLVSLNSSLLQTQNRLAEKRNLFTFLREMDQGHDEIDNLPEGIADNELLQQALLGLRNAEIQLSQNRARYTERHPTVQAAAGNVASYKSQLRDLLQSSIATTVSTIALLERQEAQVRKRAEDVSTQALALALKLVRTSGELEARAGELDASRSAYNGTLNRIEEARMSADENTAVIKKLRPASVPSRQVWPVARKVITKAVILGLLAGIGLALLTEFMEDRISSLQEIEKGMGLRVLGVLPAEKRIERPQLAKAGLDDKFGYIVETFAGVRGLLLSAQLRPMSRVILIASSMPGEGKSITACNLATSFASSGLRTLLVDFDLRRPQLATVFEVPEETPSLLHELVRADEDHAFGTLPLKGIAENLDVVVSRTSSSHSPAEVMGMRSVSEFMHWARENYDQVVVDAPPFGLVSDSAVLGNEVDGVLIVCRPKTTRKRFVRRAFDFFVSVDTPVVGVLMNGMDLGRFQRDTYGYNAYGYTPSGQLEGARRS